MATVGVRRRRLDDAQTTSLVEDLGALLGADRVLTGHDVLEQHGHDESFHPSAAPDAVVMARSTDEAAAIVRACARHRAPIVPFGAGTSLEGHVAALRAACASTCARWTGSCACRSRTSTSRVQAGVTRVALDARLRPEGVFFPVDPGADATIGGMVSTGASGTTTVRYGAMRENVLSLVVATADGSVVRTRSRARKSSAGYDLTRLFVGAEGTLGLVCEATLRLQPTPEATSAAVCALPSLQAAVDCVIAVSHHAIPVARIELLDEVQMRGDQPPLRPRPRGRADAVPGVPRDARRGAGAGRRGPGDRRRARGTLLRVGHRRGASAGGCGRRATAPTTPPARCTRAAPG